MTHARTHDGQWSTRSQSLSPCRWLPTYYCFTSCPCVLPRSSSKIHLYSHFNGWAAACFASRFRSCRLVAFPGLHSCAHITFLSFLSLQYTSTELWLTTLLRPKCLLCDDFTVSLRCSPFAERLFQTFEITLCNGRFSESLLMMTPSR